MSASQENIIAGQNNTHQSLMGTALNPAQTAATASVAATTAVAATTMTTATAAIEQKILDEKRRALKPIQELEARLKERCLAYNTKRFEVFQLENSYKEQITKLQNEISNSKNSDSPTIEKAKAACSSLVKSIHAARTVLNELYMAHQELKYQWDQLAIKRENLKILFEEATEATVFREKCLLQLDGSINPDKLISSTKKLAPSFYVVRRKFLLPKILNGITVFQEVPTIALISFGLWDPRESIPVTDHQPYVLPDMEFLIEAPESEIPIDDLENSWLYQCALKVADYAKHHNTELHSLIKYNQYATAKIRGETLPPAFLNPDTGDAHVLFGIKNGVPKSFSVSNEPSSIPIVTVRLLAWHEYRDSQEFVLGKKSLAARFVGNSSYHISSKIPNLPKPVKKRLSSPNYPELNVEDKTWTVAKLMERIRAAEQQIAISLIHSDKPLEAFPSFNDISVSEYEPPIPTGVPVNSFVTGGIATILRELTMEIRHTLSSRDYSSVMYKTAAGINRILFCQSQNYQSQQFSDYVLDPALFLKIRKSTLSASTSASRGPISLNQVIDDLQEEGHTHVKRLIKQIAWLNQVFVREQQKITPQFLLKMLSIIDTVWIQRVERFDEVSQEKRRHLRNENYAFYEDFRSLHRKEILWPHSPEFRKQVESTGFIVSPTMEYLDNCICNVCEQRIMGLRPWNDPRKQHDYSQHIPQLKTLVFSHEFETLVFFPETYHWAAFSLLISSMRANQGHIFANSLIPLIAPILNFAFCLPETEVKEQSEKNNSNNKLKDDAEKDNSKNKLKDKSDLENENEHENNIDTSKLKPKNNPSGALFVPYFMKLGFRPPPPRIEWQLKKSMTSNP